MRFDLFYSRRYYLIGLLIAMEFFPLLGLAQRPNRHATLLGWEQRVKLFMLDRDHNFGGTHFERGLFRENIASITPEHEIDLMTYRYTLMDDYQWELTRNSYKLYMGSLNAVDFAVENHFKSAFTFKDKNIFRITGIQEENKRAGRFFVNLNYERVLAGNHSIGFQHTVSRAKGDLDATFYYKFGNFRNGMIKAEITFLDWAANVTQGLAEDSENEYNNYDVTFRYETQPELLSIQLVSPGTAHFRAELLAGLQTPLEKTVTPEDTLQFIDNEWAHYAGGLLEYHNRFLTTGITYQRTFSKLKRQPASGSGYDPVFGNWQFSDRFGFFTSADLIKDIRLEHWMWYEHNTDRLQGEEVPDGLQPFDFVEKRVKIKSRILYDNRKKGFKTGIEFLADYRYPQGDDDDIVRNRDFRDVYPIIRERNERLTYTIGYRFNRHFYLLGGISYDLDMDKISGYGLPRVTGTPTWFDGGFGRLFISW